jgi:hypothetical protein
VIKLAARPRGDRRHWAAPAAEGDPAADRLGGRHRAAPAAGFDATLLAWRQASAAAPLSFLDDITAFGADRA